MAGALIGLLFVAISVSPEKIAGAKAIAEHQVRAAAAFSVLVDTLVIALIALLPEARLGPAVVTLAAGLASTAGLLILLYRKGRVRIRLGQAVLLLIPFGLYGLQLANGLRLEGAPHDTSQIGNLGGLTIGFFAFAIARAWELVGLRDSSLLAAMAGLAHQAASRDTSHPPAPAPADEADHPPPDQQ